VRKLVVPLLVLGLWACNRVDANSAAPDAETPPPPPPAAPAPDPLASAGLERVSLTIQGSLDESMRGAAKPEVAAALGQVTARLLIWWVDVARDMRRGDALDVVYQDVPGKEPLLHAVRFKSQKNEKEYRAYLFKPEGAAFAHYYDATGEEIEERLEGSPIDDYEQVTSILRDGRRHKGVDFKTPVGTPVKVPFDATLVRKNWNWRVNGNCLEFQAAQGRRVLFLHLDEIPKDVAVGKRYKAGTVVARSGNTGRSTAPHFHYQLEANRRVLDPFKIHRTYRARLGADSLPGFQKTRADYDLMLDPDSAKPAPAAAAPSSTPAPAAQASVP